MQNPNTGSPTQDRDMCAGCCGWGAVTRACGGGVMWGWVCLRSMLETHPGWITPVKEASPIPHRQGVLIFVAWDGSTPSPGAFPSPCKRGGATASSPMSFQMSGPLSVTLRLYINDGMQSLGLVVGFMFQLWAAAVFSNQTSTFQPKQAGHIWFMQTLCKWESSSLLWNPHSSVRSGCSDNKLNVVTTTQTHSHASGRVFVLFMVWLHHHEQQQLSPLSLMQSELKSCYYLDFRSFIFFVKHENRQSVQTRALR